MHAVVGGKICRHVVWWLVARVRMCGDNYTDRGTRAARTPQMNEDSQRAHIGARGTATHPPSDRQTSQEITRPHAQHILLPQASATSCAGPRNPEHPTGDRQVGRDILRGRRNASEPWQPYTPPYDGVKDQLSRYETNRILCACSAVRGPWCRHVAPCPA